MMWYRACGLAAVFCVCFCVALVAGHVYGHHRHPSSLTVSVRSQTAAPAGEPVRVIDIRREDFERMSLDLVLGLGAGDLIESVDDVPLASRTDLNLTGKESSNYIDIGVRRRGERVRMIVLLH